METRYCPTCKSLNPKEADRCIICGGLLDPVEDFPESAMPTRALVPPSNAADTNISKEVETNRDGGEIETSPSPEGSSKLRSILTSGSGTNELDVLKELGLIPGEDHPPALVQSENDRQTDSLRVGLTGNALPDWLRSAEFGRPEGVEENVPPVPKPGEEAHLADLPDWVKRLQGNFVDREPEMEATQPAGTGTSGEIPSVLPAIPSQNGGTAPFQSINLPDQELIGAVKSYLSELRNPRKPQTDRSRRLGRLSWGAIGMALIGLITILSWSGTTVASLPQVSNPQLQTIGTFIDTLAPESVVLVGIDYDLPLAGEMENASLPVLTHLMSKKVSLVFLSTHPVGPALAEHLAGLALKWQPDFPVEKLHFANYLPGGPVGLSRFALDPRGALPVNSAGTFLWAAPELARIQNVTDFSGILLITDALESGRDWIEQVEPALGGVPLDVVASSQAASLLRPYQNSGQIRGMVSGITTGAEYERMTLMTTRNQQLLRAYRGGLSFMIVLVASSLILATLIPERWLVGRKGKRKNAAG